MSWTMKSKFDFLFYLLKYLNARKLTIIQPSTFIILKYICEGVKEIVTFILIDIFMIFHGFYSPKNV